MTSACDLITVVTPTLGDSCGHLNRAMLDLRGLTKLAFRQIVSDDGTIDEGQKFRQRRIVDSFRGTTWTENPGPVWGVSYNLNHAFSLVETPWAFCVEDGLRPSMGWLETAVDAIERIGSHTWQGHTVGTMGCAHYNDWHIALAGVLPTNGRLGVMDFLNRTSAETYSCFWGSSDHPNWNDGFWCWKRMLPGFQKMCVSPESDQWPRSPAPWNFVHLVRYGCLPGSHAPRVVPSVGTAIDTDPQYLGVANCENSWPSRRLAHPAWFHGAFMLVNMEAWRKVGRFADGCPFFEGHLGIRMAQHGYLSLYLDFPPWLHYGGMGFISAATQGKTPRDHRQTDGNGPGDVLFKDFGVNGPSHVDLYNLVYENFPADKQAAIARELADVPLAMVPGWEEWL